ncbi:MAG TPA: hypothetical protein VGH27_27505 [Streptosporangiaceae bacterium]|jgi:hypothetical protein
MRPVVGLALLPLIIAGLTLAFLGLALWELALLLWHLTIRTIRTIRPGPQTTVESSSASGDVPTQASDPKLCVPAPRPPAEEDSRLRALLPPGTIVPWMSGGRAPLPWANLLRAKMAGLALMPG